MVDVVIMLLAFNMLDVCGVLNKLIVSEVPDSYRLAESDVLVLCLGSHGPLIAMTVCSTILLLHFLWPR